ncbi:MAG TPA: hypothetical protein VMR98_05110, partial [Candidatus Polarisedimenticolaceae bacterium]|nr:hypothetical protein [Candidatus Polarisedimenticolaceae bacterium]
QNLNEGGTGGTLTAGNTHIAGTLQTTDTANFMGTVTAERDLRVGGNALFKNAANSTTAFQIQNATAGSLVTVDSANANITLGGLNNPELQTWQTNGQSISARELHTSVVANGYVYVMGGYNAGGLVTVQYAKLNTDGSTGAFATTTALPIMRYFGSAATANGYVYVVGGTDVGATRDTVLFAKLNSDGTLGAWSCQGPSAAACSTGSTLTPINANSIGTGGVGAPRDTGSTVVANGYIYYLGGRNASAVVQSTVYRAKLNADGTTGAFATTTALPAAQYLHSATVANGYVYLVAGTVDGTTLKNTTYFAKLNSDGSLGAWSCQGLNATICGSALTPVNTNLMPQLTAGGGVVVANGYIYYTGGIVSSAATANIYYAPLNADGTTGTWTTSSTAIPLVRTYHTSVIANGYIYVLGGDNATANAAPQTSVYYTSTARIKIGGSVDLVGLSGENLAEGGTGGSLTAGNTKIIGALEVQDQATFSQAVVANNGLSVKTANNSTATFEVQGSTGSSEFVVDTANGRVGIGTATPARELHIADGIIRIDKSSNSAGVMMHRTGLKTFFFGVDATGSNAGEFFISDFGTAVSGASTRRLTVDTDGGVIVGDTQTSVAARFYVEGDVLFKPNTTTSPNSVTAFQVQPSGSATPVLDVDTTNSRVGIGTAAPAQELEVNGDIRLDSSVATGGNFGLCHTGATSTGAFTDRDIVACSAAASDVAEWYETEMGVDAGDLVMTTNSLFTYDEEYYDLVTGPSGRFNAHSISILGKGSSNQPGRIMGVISTNPQEVIGESVRDAPHAKNPKPLALSGRVPLKVTNENGPIAIGDPLAASSTPGHAMKAVGSVMIVGYALEGFSGTIGKIDAFVNIGHNDPESLSGQSGDFSSLNVGGEATIDGDLTVTGTTKTKSLLVDGTATITKVVVKTVEVAGDLTVHGTATVKKLTVTGDAEFQGNVVVKGDASFEKDINLVGAAGQSRNAITRRFKASKDLHVGDVVVGDPAKDGQVTTTTVAADTKVLGIALTDTPADQDATIAVGGSVQVKTSATVTANGDLLVSSSQEGKADKSSAPLPGTVIGKALGKPDAAGLVWVLVTLN